MPVNTKNPDKAWYISYADVPIWLFNNVYPLNAYKPEEYQFKVPDNWYNSWGVTDNPSREKCLNRYYDAAKETTPRSTTTFERCIELLPDVRRVLILYEFCVIQNAITKERIPVSILGKC